MKTFLARLIFRITAGEGASNSVFEEQLRLIFAGTAEEAYEKGRQAGLAENITLPHIEKGFVKWEFCGILELTNVKELTNGLLLNSSSRETSDPAGFLNYLSYRESLQNEPSEPVG